MQKKLIKKYQNAHGSLILKNDNTLVVQPVLPIPATNIDWTAVANNKIDKAIQKQPHSEVVRHPKKPKTEKEAMTIMFDPRKTPQTSTTQVIGMSPVDPIGEFVVGNAVLGKPLQLLGKGIMYGTGRYLPSTEFGNWSRAKLISNLMTPRPYISYNPWDAVKSELNDPNAYFHAERNLLPKTRGGTYLHPLHDTVNGAPPKIWLAEWKPWIYPYLRPIYKIPKNKVITSSSKTISKSHPEHFVTDNIDLLQNGVEIYLPMNIIPKTSGTTLQVIGRKKFFVPQIKQTVKTVVTEPLN